MFNRKASTKLHSEGKEVTKTLYRNAMAEISESFVLMAKKACSRMLKCGGGRYYKKLGMITKADRKAFPITV
jgi:hypothetical protein